MFVFVATLTDAACMEVIRLFQHENGYNNLNQLLLQIILIILKIAQQNMHVESLERMNNGVKQITQMDNDSGKNSAKDISTSDDITLFPLFRLPVDIIKNTSLFLNENDIFHFENVVK